MKQLQMRVTVLHKCVVGALRAGLCAAALCLLLPAAVSAQAAEPVTFDIPQLPLPQALKVFAEQSGMQLLYRPDTVTGVEARPVHGRLDQRPALQRLLQGSDLEIVYSGDNAATIRPRSREPGTRRIGPDGDSAPGSQEEAAGRHEGAAARTNSGQVTELDMIVVTAQKREERLQDVPVPVTAVSADTLVDSNQLRIQDYASRIPGLNVTPGDLRGVPILAIRGLTTGGATNPTVGISVDDMPYGSSTSLGGGFTAPDIDPSDLARVEVLRGPQGTLYGASSLGGLIKFVTVDPSTDGVAGRVQAGLNDVHNGDGVGYGVRGAINVPLSDTWAVRASGFTRRDAGYIDDPGLGTDGVNSGDAHGGRISALWRPSEDFSLKVSALVQDLSSDGSSSVHLLPGLGDLQHSELLNTGWFEKKFEAYSANLTAMIGNAELTAVSGYSVNTRTSSFDLTPSLGSVSEAFFGVAGTPQLEDNKTTKFTQEVRVLFLVGQKLEWLIGAFYTDENSLWSSSILAADPATGASIGLLRNNSSPTTYEEYAAFTNLTFHLTERFDLQIGGRESRNKQTLMQTLTGPLVPGGISVAQAESEGNAFTYLLTPKFKLSPDMMIYARLASGYRAGGPNINAAAGTPSSFDSDETKNYEIGIKGDFFDHAVSLDASLYYIDWKDLQIILRDPPDFVPYFGNAGRAKSQGVELSVESRPVAGLTVAAWVAWNDATLTEDLPPTSPAVGRSGDRLPFSSRFSGNLSVDHEFSLTNNVTGFVGGSMSYVSDRNGVFLGTTQRENFPAYTKTDLRAGVKCDSWAATFFVNNITDKRAAVGGGRGEWLPYIFWYIQPRTIGLSVSKTF